MAMGPVSDDRTATIERATRVAVPVALGVVTWLVLLIVAGTLARFDPSSLLNLLPLLIVGLMLWPLWLLAPWKSGVTERVTSFFTKRRTELVVMGVLVVLSVLPFVPGQLRGILNIPYRSAGMLFGPSLIYRQRVDPRFGQVLLTFGQWYLEAFWLFVIASGLTSVGRRFR